MTFRRCFGAKKKKPKRQNNIQHGIIDLKGKKKSFKVKLFERDIIKYKRILLFFFHRTFSRRPVRAEGEIIINDIKYCFGMSGKKLL